jgi:hypothetical protein
MYRGTAPARILASKRGFCSGGNVTILTTVYVALFRQSFVEAVATTKLINIFSSAIATAVFMSRHLIDYRLGCILGLTMFAGALLGARVKGTLFRRASESFSRGETRRRSLSGLGCRAGQPRLAGYFTSRMRARRYGQCSQIPRRRGISQARHPVSPDRGGGEFSS